MRVITTDRLLKLVGQGRIFADGFRPANLSGHDTYTFSLAPVFRRLADTGLIDTADLQAMTLTESRMREDGFTLQPGQFVHFMTAESLRLDARTACWLSTHPKMAKLGLDFLQSSFLVPPGSEGPLTLETSNRGPCAVRLYPAVPVVKAVFFDIG